MKSEGEGIEIDIKRKRDLINKKIVYHLNID